MSRYLRSHARAANSIPTSNEPLSCQNVTPEPPPISGSSAQLPGPMAAITSGKERGKHRRTGEISKIPFPLMQENIVLPNSSFIPRPSLAATSYGSFFDELGNSVPAYPTSYESFWSSKLLRLPSSMTESLIETQPLLPGSNSSSIPLASSYPNTPALSLSAMSLEDSISDELLTMTDDFDFIQDAPQDLLPALSSSASMKRKSQLNNNISALRSHSPTQFEEPDPKRIKLPDSSLPIAQKLDKVFDYLKTLEWSTEDFLKHLFAPKTRTSTRSQRHGLIMERFLSGRDHYTVSKLLESMWITFDGAGHNSVEMYSVTIPYLEIGPARAAISSFAAQIVEAQLIQEAQAGIDKDNGMHASIKTRNDGRVEWASIGASLIPTIQANLSQHMSLAFQYMLQITSPRPCK
jgi:hypothetical protein